MRARSARIDLVRSANESLPVVTKLTSASSIERKARSVARSAVSAQSVSWPSSRSALRTPSVQDVPAAAWSRAASRAVSTILACTASTRSRSFSWPPPAASRSASVASRQRLAARIAASYSPTMPRSTSRPSISASASASRFASRSAASRRASAPASGCRRRSPRGRSRTRPRNRARRRRSRDP